MKRLVKVKSQQGQKDGPAIAGIDERLLNRDVLDDDLHGIILELSQTNRSLFPGKMEI